jgi:hypothetical protein
MRFLFLLISAGFLTSCCPEFVFETNVDTRVREVTITRFNPTFTTVPAPDYSVHTFRFPSDIQSSGDLPNDFRVQNGQVLTREVPIIGTTLRLRMTTQYPQNSLLNSDIIVIGTGGQGTANARALLRFGGTLEGPLATSTEPLSLLAGVPRRFTFSADANLFGQRVRDIIPTQAAVQAVNTIASQFGATMTNRRTQTINAPVGTVQWTILSVDGGTVFTSNNTTALLSQLQTILTTAGSTLTGQSVIQQFETTDIEVAVGDYYYYRAINGLEFILLIEDVRQSTATPFLQRVTIKFAQAIPSGSCPPVPTIP